MRKMIIICFVFLLATLMVLPASAVQNPYINDAHTLAAEYSIDARLRDAQLGIIDESIESQILDSIAVSYCADSSISSRSNENNISDTPTYSLRNLGEIYDNGEAIGTVYALTATEKTSSNSASQGSANAWISIVWIDNLGVNNELVSVTGGWNPNGHELSDRYVSYTVTQYSGDSGYTIGSSPAGNSFNITVGASGYLFSATSEVCVDGALSRLTVSVASSIWD